MWEFKVSDIEKQSRSNKRNPGVHQLHKEGFENLRAGLEEFIQENDITLDDDYAFFKVYASAIVGSTDIIRATASFYKNECFNDVSVSVEGGVVWYGKVRKNYIISLIHPMLKFIYLVGAAIIGFVC